MPSYSHHNHHLASFLQNKEMNEIYLSYGIMNFAIGLISVFIPIYLYDSGYSIPWVMLFYVLLPLYFVIFAYTGARIVARIGIKRSLLVSIILTIALFAGMRKVDTYPWLFWFLPLVYALKAMFYNYSFTLNFIQHSDRKHRGKQVSALQASALIASILSPFLGGVMITMFSFKLVFVIASVLMLASLVPLMFFKETYEKVTFGKGNLYKELFYKKNRPMVYSFTGFAVEEWIGYVIWPIFLSVVLGGVKAVGIVSSLSIGLTFVVIYFVGKITDKKDKREMIRLATVFYFFGLAGRIFADNFVSVLFVDTYKRITGQVLHIPWTSYTYDLAAKSDYFKFIVQREIIFDLSRVIVIPFIILIFVINFHPFAISFILAALFSLLYAALSKAEIDIVPPIKLAQVEKVKSDAK
ncbi:MFS transporter [Candidatus Falkowbacteria bacterium]|nr:MFS transporter [Candidatus Falkowbacteria bacterium]